MGYITLGRNLFWSSILIFMNLIFHAIRFLNFHFVKVEILWKCKCTTKIWIIASWERVSTQCVCIGAIGCKKMIQDKQYVLTTYLPITYNHWTSIAIIIYYSYRSTRRYLIANYLLQYVAKAFLKSNFNLYRLDFANYFNNLFGATLF